MTWTNPLLIVSIEEDSYNKSREREEVLKKLVNSQEVYIRELESKKHELESEMRLVRNSKAHDQSERQNRSAQKEYQNHTSESQVSPSC